MDVKVGVGHVMNTRDFANYFGCSREMVIKFLEYSELQDRKGVMGSGLDQQTAVIDQCNGEKVVQGENG